MKNLELIQKAWNGLNTDEARWRYVLSHKNEISIRLDNDSTYAVFHSEIIPDGISDWDDLPELNGFDGWIGNCPGVDDLMEVLGIEANGV